MKIFVSLVVNTAIPNVVGKKTKGYQIKVTTWMKLFVSPVVNTGTTGV